jgi:hypothetical protein
MDGTAAPHGVLLRERLVLLQQSLQLSVVFLYIVCGLTIYKIHCVLVALQKTVSTLQQDVLCSDRLEATAAVQPPRRKLMGLKGAGGEKEIVRRRSTGVMYSPTVSRARSDDFTMDPGIADDSYATERGGVVPYVRRPEDDEESSDSGLVLKRVESDQSEGNGQSDEGDPESLEHYKAMVQAFRDKERNWQREKQSLLQQDIRRERMLQRMMREAKGGPRNSLGESDFDRVPSDRSTNRESHRDSCRGRRSDRLVSPAGDSYRLQANSTRLASPQRGGGGADSTRTSSGSRFYAAMLEKKSLDVRAQVKPGPAGQVDRVEGAEGGAKTQNIRLQMQNNPLLNGLKRTASF